MTSSYISNANPAYIESLYQQYQQDPASVDPQWKHFFDGYEYGAVSCGFNEADYTGKEVRIMKLINAYRARGHLVANTNPVRQRRLHPADLNLEYFGLGEEDLDQEFEVGREIRLGRATLRAIVEHLQKTYCSSIGVEYRYTTDSSVRQYLHEAMEGTGNRTDFNKDQKKHIYTKLSEAVNLERFLHVKYVGQKRFSLEGTEAAIPALDALFEEGARLGVGEFVMGMPHRGRLSVLTNLFHKKFESLFSEFEGSTLPDEVGGDGDVKYHMGHSADVTTTDGHKLHLCLIANPSHLEAVNPVVLGSVRAKLENVYNGEFKKICPILLHGDAAIAGQGIVYECSQFANLEGYANGGVIHVVINNQVGFTANYRESRSALYCTDIAKVLASPVFHVNADDPEAVVHVCQLAIRLRQKFGIDVYIDILGYRRHGHNEGDEPRFTQPLLYKSIDKHASVLDIYTQQLISSGALTQSDADAINQKFTDHLQNALTVIRSKDKKVLEVDFLRGRQWATLRKPQAGDFDRSPATRISKAQLDKLAKAITTLPDGFKLIKKAEKIVTSRAEAYAAEAIDWGLGEHLAFASLVTEGHRVRISGQDSRRGTFSHRHSYLIDENDESLYVPLNHIEKSQARYEAFNSHLSEYGVMGFEFGYAQSMPQVLTVWEAQFGDFANGAQIIVDQFLSSTGSKWHRYNGLVCFLPHGYEGQGPEHSSARMERFLLLCAEDNMYVTNVSTPANFFHLLRRQIKAPFRIPLVAMTPKSLLRHPRCVSSIADFTQSDFQETIDDASVKSAKGIERLILCSGKIYYELLERKEKEGHKGVAIVRLEQLFPIPAAQDAALLKKYGAVKDWVWVQEEPENMGAWSFIHSFRFHELRPDIRVIARKRSASPAHGNYKIEAKYQEKILAKAFADLKTSKP